MDESGGPDRRHGNHVSRLSRLAEVPLLVKIHVAGPVKFLWRQLSFKLQ